MEPFSVHLRSPLYKNAMRPVSGKNGLRLANAYERLSGDLKHDRGDKTRSTPLVYHSRLFCWQKSLERIQNGILTQEYGKEFWTTHQSQEATI